MLLRSILIIVGFLSPSLAAHELNPMQITYTELKVAAELKQPIDTLSVGQLNEVVKRFDDVEQIVAIHKLLGKLSQVSSPSQGQMNWVKGFLDSKERIMTRPVDHPEKLLEVISVSRQAHTTLQLWEMAKRQKDIEQQWQSNSWKWPENLDSETLQSLVNWIGEQNVEQARGIALHFLLHGSPQALNSNKLVSALALKSGSEEIYQRLWQLPPDQHTYTTLAKISGTLDEDKAVEQINMAMDQPKLASQALLVLAKNYSHNQQAQQRFFEAFKNKELAWHAAAASKVIGSAAFKYSLAKSLKREKSKAATFALKHLQEGDEQ